MIKLPIFILLVLAMFCSCAGQPAPQEAIQIDIIGAQEKILSELNQLGIPHSIDNQNRIWYPVSYREQVSNISLKVSAELSPVTMALFPDTEILNEVTNKFEASEIPYTLEKSELGVFIKWDDHNAIKGTFIANEFIYKINNAL